MRFRSRKHHIESEPRQVVLVWTILRMDEENKMTDDEGGSEEVPGQKEEQE